MKAYLMTTSVVFGLIVLSHVWRIVEEGQHLARDPFYISITALAAAFCLWAWRLLWRMQRQ
jgi:hypothetical protein